MKAQILYDLREKYEFCSGTDLHEFFDYVLGEPSPKGIEEINPEVAQKFVISCCNAIEHNSSIDMSACRIAAIGESFLPYPNR